MRQVLFVILSIYIMVGYGQRLKKFEVVESGLYQRSFALIGSENKKDAFNDRVSFGEMSDASAYINLVPLASYKPTSYSGFGLRHVPNEYQDVFLVYHLPELEGKSKMEVQWSLSNFDMLFISYSRLFEFN